MFITELDTLVGNNSGTSEVYQPISKLNILLEKIEYQRKDKNENGLINSLEELQAYYLVNNDVEKELKAAEEKVIYLEKADLNLKAIFTLIEIGKKYATIGNFQKATENHDHAISLQKKIDAQKTYADLCFDLGEFYSSKEKYDLALKYYEKSLAKFKELDLEAEYVNTGIIISDIFSLLGLKPKALDLYNETLLFVKKIKDQQSIVRCKKGIGQIYHSLKEYSKAIKYYEEAAKICEVNNLYLEQVKVYNNLSATYIEQNELHKAEEIALKASELLKKSQNINDLSNNYNLLGDISLESESYLKAKLYYQESFSLSNKIENSQITIENYNDEGNLFIQINDFENAIKSCEQGYKLAKENNFKHLLLNSCQCLSVAHKKNENTSKSYKYFEEQNTLEKELFSTSKAKEIGKIEGKYEYKLLSQENIHKIEDLKKQNKTQKIFAGFLTVTAIILTLLGMILYRQYKIKHKNHDALLKLHRKLKVSNNNQEKLNQTLNQANRKKQVLNERLEKTNSDLAELNKVYNTVNRMLQESNEKLEHANSSLANFASVAAHDLKAPLRSISSFTNLLHRKNKTNFDETDKEYFKFIIDNTIRMQRMIDSLLVFSKIDKNLPEPEEVKLEDIIKNTCNNLNTAIKETNAKIELDKYLPTLIAHAPLIEQLIQNILNNAIKFRKPNTAPLIKIKAKYSIYDGLHHITITDNGIGIEEKNIENAFELFTRFNKASEYEGSGIGLSTCKKIVAYYGGEIWMESKFGEGTAVHFTLKA